MKKDPHCRAAQPPATLTEIACFLSVLATVQPSQMLPCLAVFGKVLILVYTAEKLLETPVVAIELIASRSIDAATEISAIANRNPHILSMHTSLMDGTVGHPIQQDKLWRRRSGWFPLQDGPDLTWLLVKVTSSKALCFDSCNKFV